MTFASLGKVGGNLTKVYQNILGILRMILLRESILAACNLVSGLLFQD